MTKKSGTRREGKQQSHQLHFAISRPTINHRPARCFWACGGRRVLPAPSHRRHSRYEERRPWCWHSSIPQPWGPAAALPAAAAGGTRARLASAQRDAGDSRACGPSRPSVYAVSMHWRRGTPWIKVAFTCMGTSR